MSHNQENSLIQLKENEISIQDGNANTTNMSTKGSGNMFQEDIQLFKNTLQKINNEELMR